MFIRTSRLFLRPGWAEDAADFTRAIGHAEVVPALASTLWPCDEEAVRAFLDAPRPPRFPALLVTLPAERGRIVGGCALEDGESGAARVSFWITPGAQRQGFAREALGALIGAAPLLGHERLAARHTPDNHAAASLLAAHGFRPADTPSAGDYLIRGSGPASIDYTLQLRPAERAQRDWTSPRAYAAIIEAPAPS